MSADSKYIRQELLTEVGISGQEKLRTSCVLIVGAGGLGCPAALYLAACGVGKLILVDDDVVEWNNLHRQVLYAANDVGSFKAKAAAAFIAERYPDTETSGINKEFNQTLAAELLPLCDLVLDCTDRIHSRYLINDACVLYGKPWVHASLRKFQYQCAVFSPENGCHYRNAFPVPPNPFTLQTCSTAGILGSVAGQAGLAQATEAIKYILGLHRTEGRLQIHDVLNGEWMHVKMPAGPNAGGPASKEDFMQFDYVGFCNRFNT